MELDGQILPVKPQRAFRDHARTVGNAAIAGIPVVGGSALALIDGILRPSYQKRLDAWLEQLGDVARELEVTPGFLDEVAVKENELFVSAVATATQIALGTHLEAKLGMLKRALVRVATDDATDDFLVMRYLAFVEELAPEHVSLLSYATDPSLWHKGWAESDAATPRALIDRAGLPVDANLIELLLADLLTRRLVRCDDLHTTALGEMATRPFSTRLGQGFVHFVGEM